MMWSLPWPDVCIPLLVFIVLTEGQCPKFATDGGLTDSFQVSGVCYYSVKRSMTQPDAIALCQSEGTRLPVYQDPAKQQSVDSFLSGFFVRHWIGLMKISGVWVWWDNGWTSPMAVGENRFVEGEAEVYAIAWGGDEFEGHPVEAEYKVVCEDDTAFTTTVTSTQSTAASTTTVTTTEQTSDASTTTVSTTELSTDASTTTEQSTDASTTTITTTEQSTDASTTTITTTEQSTDASTTTVTTAEQSTDASPTAVTTVEQSTDASTTAVTTAQQSTDASTTTITTTEQSTDASTTAQQSTDATTSTIPTTPGSTVNVQCDRAGLNNEPLITAAFKRVSSHSSVQIIEAWTTTTSIDCANACLSRDLCCSFIYQTVQRTCSLLQQVTSGENVTCTALEKCFRFS